MTLSPNPSSTKQLYRNQLLPDIFNEEDNGGLCIPVDSSTEDIDVLSVTSPLVIDSLANGGESKRKIAEFFIGISDKS